MLRFLRLYNPAASPAQLERLKSEAEAYSLASDVFWAAWATVQVQVSDLEYNYLEYAEGRLRRFHRMQPLLEAKFGGPQ